MRADHHRRLPRRREPGDPRAGHRRQRRTARSTWCGATTTRRSSTASPPTTSANPVLTLDRSPVDDFHRPRAGQAVQVLRAAAELERPTARSRATSPRSTGEVGVLAAPYDPDTKTVQFPAAAAGRVHRRRRDAAAVPARLGGAAHRHKLGDPITLTGTGIDVTLTVDGGGPCTSATSGRSASARRRPTRFSRRGCCARRSRRTGRAVGLPARRDRVERRRARLLDDCRHPFKPLTELEDGECCCTVSVGPSDASARGLQDDRRRGRRRPRATRPRAPRHRLLRPGRYELASAACCSPAPQPPPPRGVRRGRRARRAGRSESTFVAGADRLVARRQRADQRDRVPHARRFPRRTAQVRPQERELRSFQAPVAAVVQRPVRLDRDPSGSLCGAGGRPLPLPIHRRPRAQRRQRASRRPDASCSASGSSPRSECWGMRVEHNRFLHDAPHQAPTLHVPDPRAPSVS